VTSPGGTADRVVDFFDRLAVDYDHEYAQDTTAGFALRVRRRKVLDLFGQVRGNVLDVGCGPGVMTDEMLARACSFWGIDPSENMIAIARSRVGPDADARFVQGDAGRLPFDDNFFDAVLCMGVIDSVPDGSQAIREMVRVLKPGGVLIVSVANLLSPYAWWKNYGYYPLVAVWHRVRKGLGDPTMTAGRVRSVPLRRLYSRRSAGRLLASEGARVTETVPYYFNVFLSPLDELLPRAALRVTERLEEGQWSRLEWLASGWILKGTKA
jgi:ubiquinone/menaquinone biosynthesis C-methylase UbiE